MREELRRLRMAMFDCRVGSDDFNELLRRVNELETQINNQESVEITIRREHVM